MSENETKYILPSQDPEPVYYRTSADIAATGAAICAILGTVVNILTIWVILGRVTQVLIDDCCDGLRLVQRICFH